MERGRHFELLRLDGIYKNLVSRQLVNDKIVIVEDIQERSANTPRAN